MATERQSRVSKHVWGWPVVGFASAILLGAGVSVMTGPHVYIADGFFALGFALLVIKFWTWEEAKHDTTRKTAMLLAGVTVAALVLFVGACYLSHYLNAPKQPNAEVARNQSPDKQLPHAEPVLPPTPAEQPPKANAKPSLPPKAARSVKPSSQEESKNTPQRANPAPPESAPPVYGGQTCYGSACAQGPGAQATYNQLGSPLPEVTATPQMQRQTGDPNRPWQTVFTVTSNVPVQTGDLKLKCTGPVLLAGISRINPMSFISGSNGPDLNDPETVVYELSPEPLSAGKPVEVVVYSMNPVTVVSGTIGSNPIVFRSSR